LLPLYKSRLVLAEVHAGKPIDANVRAARKEMKTAMEVFQNKLRPAFGGPGEAASVVSSANSEENMSSAGLSMRLIEVSSTATTTTTTSPPPPTGSVLLQKLNRSALCLKAHLEQLKGNTKKSLILCGEAQTATAGHDPDYEAIHYNNLAVVYETTDRRHLALHALAKSIRADPRNNNINNNNDDDDTQAQQQQPKQLTIGDLFHADGTARPDPTVSILHNAALCALRAQNFESAYECLATCIAHSEVFRNHPFCWIRLAEACIGIYSQQLQTSRRNQTKDNNNQKFSAVTGVDGIPHALIIDKAIFREDLGVVRETLQGQLGSREDLVSNGIGCREQTRFSTPS
jgi:Tfp pilus assembly protein PilF